MCRLLVYHDHDSAALCRRTQSYAQLLELSMELDNAADMTIAMERLSSGPRVDILMLSAGPSGQAFAERARRVQPWIRCMLLQDSPTLPRSGSPGDLYMPENWGIEHFYRALSTLSPETAEAAKLPNQQQEAPSPSVLNRILSVLHIIETEYQDDIGLEYIAQQIYISPCYLSTLFSRFMGVSLLSYLNDFRMQRAVELLLHSDRKVTDICQKVGYRNLPYFCTCFKNRFNMTPAQYRRQYAVPESA